MKKVKLKGLEPYEVDDSGNVYGLKGQILKPYGRGKNRAYKTVSLFRKAYSVHRLVAYGFGLIDSLKYSGNQIDHINEIKTDNRLSNLQVLTNSQNVRKSKGGCMNLPKGVSLIKKIGLYRYTTYDDLENFPKGRVVKHSKSLDELIKFINEQ